MLSVLLLLPLALPQTHVAAEATLSAESVASGGTVDVVIQVEVDQGWHLYHPDQDPSWGIPVSADVSGTDFSGGALVSSTAGQPHDVVFGTETANYLWLSGTVELRVPVSVSGAPGERELTVDFNWQVCDDSVCLAPDSQTFTLPVTVTAAAAGTAPAASAADSSSAPDSAPAATQSPVEPLVGDGFEHVRPSLVEVRGAKIAEGEELVLVYELVVDEDWHVYHPDQDPAAGVPVTSQIGGQGLEISGPVTSPDKPHEEIAAWGDVYLWQSGSPRYHQPVTVTVSGGEVQATATIGWQTCDDSHCLFETSWSVDLDQATLEALLVSDTSSGGAAAGVVEAGVQAPDLLSGGLIGFLLAAIAAGFLTLLTPCVFPMLPVTISYFTKRSESGKGTPLGNATAYAGGIVFTWVGVGVGAALLLGPTGANAIGSNPFINIGIGLLFVVMAASLLGFFEINAPKFLQKFASKAQADGQKKSGYLPVVVMAVAFSITAFTCTVGFVGAIFALGLQLGLVYLVGGMLVYGLVFAAPFFFLALVPDRLSKLPQAGGWMNKVKVSAGFIELIAAIKFFSNADLFWEFELITWPVFIGLTVVLLALWAAYLFGLYRTKHDYDKVKPSKARLVLASFITVSAVYLSMGLFERPYAYKYKILSYTPPWDYGLGLEDENGHKIGAAEISWIEDYYEAFEWAIEHDQPLFLDFTGVTCVNCRLMEYNVFPDELVKPLLIQFARAELWVDREPEWADMEVERFSSAQQPLYVLIDPRRGVEGEGLVLARFDEGYNPDPAVFAEFLQSGLDAYAGADL